MTDSILTKRLDLCLKLAELSKCSNAGRTTYKALLNQQLDKLIQGQIVSKLWNFFPGEPSSKEHSHENLFKAVSFLKEVCNKVEAHLVTRNNCDIKELFRDNLKTQVISRIPACFHTCVYETYSTAFRAFLVLQEKNSLHEVSDISDTDMMLDEEYSGNDYDNHLANKPANSECYGCLGHLDKCKCQHICNQFWVMNTTLKNLNLMKPLVGDIVIKIVRYFTEKKISAKCKSNFSVSFIDELQNWVENTVKKWIIDVYGLSEHHEIDSIGTRLIKFLNDTYADIRVTHLFDIILDYPDSEAAIEDMRRCIDQSGSSRFRFNLIETVKQSLVKSLLHPGVNTLDILTAYISSIKALRALDPTGFILQLVTEPIRKYLKSRDDTVRCIVATLTDEDDSALNEEMMKSFLDKSNSKTAGLTCDIDGETITVSNWSKWKPDPVDITATDDNLKSNRFSDIVSILVDIYETRDRFVEEYQKNLSHRLLNKYEDCNFESELRNLELLKMRFNDCELYRCEVMLKDIQSSKRINKRILGNEISEYKLARFRNIDVLVISSPFWPEKFGPLASLNEEGADLEFPHDINNAMKNYTKAFETIKASRTLHWRHHLGLVDLDLTSEGQNSKTLNFKVTPLHASLLFLFQEKKVWKLNELMAKTSMSASTLRSRLTLWTRNGVIKDSKNDQYELIFDDN